MLAAAYLAMNPPTVELPGVRRPAQHRFEWLAPVLLVDAVFVLFLAAQAAAFFGGHDYIRAHHRAHLRRVRPPGLRPAHLRHGADADRRLGGGAQGAADTAADRWWLRGSLGALCLLTLVVVASALHRMDLYQDAYGFTRLRLLVDLFEGWLGLVVLGGARRRHRPARLVAPADGAALRGGAAARARGRQPGRVDRASTTSIATRRPARSTGPTCRGLSADATPTLAALPPEQAACALE